MMIKRAAALLGKNLLQNTNQLTTQKWMKYEKLRNVRALGSNFGSGEGCTWKLKDNKHVHGV